MRELFQDRGGEIFRWMQKAIISNSLSLTRAFRVLAYGVQEAQKY